MTSTRKLNRPTDVLVLCSQQFAQRITTFKYTQMQRLEVIVQSKIISTPKNYQDYPFICETLARIARTWTRVAPLSNVIRTSTIVQTINLSMSPTDSDIYKSYSNLSMNNKIY